MTWKEKHCTMKGISREMILRNFGEEEANRVYPQMQTKKIPRKNERTAFYLEKLILDFINEKGYATEKDILKLAGKEKEVNLKRILGEVIEKYNLKKVRANKKLKRKLFIKEKGYPYVIMSQNYPLDFKYGEIPDGILEDEEN